ncbi:TonB-dependent receptor [Haliea salexigens]|uniref:TonB-dependent receptor n=1 Tax=Haliea salexigens TaxID=287487 RepID=UPI0004292934|nr:TonB-dependent receptor [Haliea salexigens]
MFARFDKSLKVLPLAVACACVTNTASAQMLEEVVVTAQKRSQSLQDVPISINAVSGEKLREAGITRIADLQVYVPNLTMSEAAIGSNIYIRGVGSQVNQGFEQSVGTYVDGIYFGRPRQLRAPFFDLERVEVLRGPQSILFGKNSIAGALNLVTAKPTDEFEGSISALLEPDHGELETSLVLSGPITDALAGRLAVRYREIDGFIDNVAKDLDEMETEETVVRGALRWDATENLQVDLKLETGEFNSVGRNSIIIGSPAPGGATPVLNDFTRKAALDPEFSDNNYDNATLTLNYQLGEFELVSTTGWSAYDYTEEVDTDFGVGSTVQSPAAEDFEQLSQELRLVSPLGQTFEHILGVFYQTSETDYAEPARITLPSVAVELDRNFFSDSDLWAVFGQSTWNVSNNFRATLGLRYTVEDKEGGRKLVTRNLDGSVFNPLGLSGFAELGMPLPPLGVTPHDLRGERDEEVVTPLLNLQWDVATDAMLYASVSTGYKAGGFDARSNRATLPDGRPALEFEEEEALSMELGAKLGLMDGAAELNVAVFRTEYDDLQVSVFDGVLGFDVQNAASATTQGLEMDGRWQLTDKLRLTGAFAYTDFEFEDYEDGACYKGQQPNQVVDGVPFCDWSGNTNQFTPEFSGTLGVDFVQPVFGNLELRSTLDVIYSDDYYAAPDLDPNALQDSYVKLNARFALGRADGTWEVALVGKNLTDEEIITFANDVPLTGPVTSYFAFVERPRTVAVQATYNF